jgi:integrase
MGVLFQPVELLAETGSLGEIVSRVRVASKGPCKEEVADAVLGAVKDPGLTIRDGLALYFEKLCVSVIRVKSAEQVAKWRLPKERAVENFVALCGNIMMSEIDRQHAQAFYDWWSKRLDPPTDHRAMKPNSANRDLGNLRKLFREYWSYEGQEDRVNPFRNLRFSDTCEDATPPFSDQWVIERILKPGVFDGLNVQAKLIVYALIETGCRPSEIANLHSSDINLECDVPYISIRPKSKRQLKSASSKREIPLVGISLAGMREAPNGFPHYRDKASLLSNSLMKAFRSRGLLETERHRIYSFRHAFEKRMLEGGLDYGLRCTLMGHKNNRPEYGDGGSLEFRQMELLKIAHQIGSIL